MIETSQTTLPIISQSYAVNAIKKNTPPEDKKRIIEYHFNSKSARNIKLELTLEEALRLYKVDVKHCMLSGKMIAYHKRVKYGR